MKIRVKLAVEMVIGARYRNDEIARFRSITGALILIQINIRVENCFFFGKVRNAYSTSFEIEINKYHGRCRRVEDGEGRIL